MRKKSKNRLAILPADLREGTVDSKQGPEFMNGDGTFMKPKPGDVRPIPHQPNGVPSLLNKTDVMAILKVSRSTIQAAMLAGELGFVKFGRAVRFRSDDIMAFVAGKSIAPTKEGK